MPLQPSSWKKRKGVAEKREKEFLKKAKRRCWKKRKGVLEKKRTGVLEKKRKGVLEKKRKGVPEKREKEFRKKKRKGVQLEKEKRFYTILITISENFSPSTAFGIDNFLQKLFSFPGGVGERSVSKFPMRASALYNFWNVPSQKVSIPSLPCLLWVKLTHKVRVAGCFGL